MKKELDDMENGDDVDSSEEASETARCGQGSGNGPGRNRRRTGKRGSESHGADPRENAGDLRQASERRHGYQVPDRQSRIYDQGVGSFLREIRQCAGCHRAALEEKIEKEKVERLEEKLTGMSETAEEPDEVDSILAQSVKTTEEGSDPKTWYITCFSEDGIWCKKFTEGQEGEDLWRMELRILPSTRRC